MFECFPMIQKDALRPPLLVYASKIQFKLVNIDDFIKLSSQ